MDYILLSAIVVGLTEVIKKASNIYSKYVPIVAILVTFAVLGSYVVATKIPFSWEIIQQGFIVALGSVGLYSGVKTTLK